MTRQSEYMRRKRAADPDAARARERAWYARNPLCRTEDPGKRRWATDHPRLVRR